MVAKAIKLDTNAVVAIKKLRRVGASKTGMELPTLREIMLLQVQPHLRRTCVASPEAPPEVLLLLNLLLLYLSPSPSAASPSVSSPVSSSCCCRSCSTRTSSLCTRYVRCMCGPSLTWLGSGPGLGPGRPARGSGLGSSPCARSAEHA